MNTINHPNAKCESDLPQEHKQTLRCGAMGVDGVVRRGMYTNLGWFNPYRLVFFVCDVWPLGHPKLPGVQEERSPNKWVDSGRLVAQAKGQAQLGQHQLPNFGVLQRK